MWFDSHCHLHLCEGGASATIERAHHSGVTDMVTLGIEIESSRTALELASAEGVWAACGVHPNDCVDFDDRDEQELDRMLADDRAVAVGESGLDFYRDDVDPWIQRRVFGVHIALAKRHDKPLVIHTRDSVQATLEQLEASGPPARLVFHCWSGGSEDLQRAVDLGSFVSFAGNVSFSSANDLREAAGLVPEDRLLVETDAPFLSPEPHRGKPNEPARVADVGRAVAAARNVSPERLARTTSANARTLFGLK